MDRRIRSVFASVRWAGVLLLALCTLSSRAMAQPAEVVKVTAVADRASLSPGGEFAVAIIFDHTEGWHVQSNLAAEDFIPTSIEVVPNPRVRAGPIQWPPEQKLVQGSGKYKLELSVFEGRAVAYVPFIVQQDATGPLSLDFNVSYQACNSNVCLPQETAKVQVTYTLAPSGDPAALRVIPESVPDFKNFDASVYGKMKSGEVKDQPASGARSRFDFFGAAFYVDSSSYVLILVIAFAAGFLLNFTPCVLPVIPLKIMSLQQQAGNKAKLLLFGTVYCAGILATFAVLGLLIFGLVSGGQKQDWGQIFSNKWFTIAVAAIVGIMGLGMMGLFTFRLPQFVYLVSPSHDSVTGNFLMGVLTGILSTPCTGPLLAATIAWATKQPPWLGLVTFIIMGTGMAFPYAVLIGFPRLVDRLPKAGPGGELLKQVLGVFMLAVAAFFATTLSGESWTWYIVGGIGCAACIWAIIGAFRMLRSAAAKRWVTALALLAFIATAVATRSLAYEGPIPWKRFRNIADAQLQAAIRDATARGETVVVDFTARWCSNCHVIEKTILNSDEGVKLLTGAGVRAFRVDLSVALQDQGWGTLKQISGGGGIPVIAVFRPGVEKPVFFNSFFAVSDLAEAVAGKRS